MFLWARRDSPTLQEGDVIISFDPPDQGDEDNWLLLATRDRHYQTIAKELEKQARVYHSQNDHRAAKVAEDLAKELRRQVDANPMVN